MATNVSIQKENERQQKIHSKSFKITKEIANQIFVERNLERKKILALDLLDKMVYQKSIDNFRISVEKTRNINDIDKLVSNLYLAQNLCKTIK